MSTHTPPQGRNDADAGWCNQTLCLFLENTVGVCVACIGTGGSTWTSNLGDRCGSFNCPTGSPSDLFCREDPQVIGVEAGCYRAADHDQSRQNVHLWQLAERVVRGEQFVRRGIDCSRRIEAVHESACALLVSQVRRCRYPTSLIC